MGAAEAVSAQESPRRAADWLIRRQPSPTFAILRKRPADLRTAHERNDERASMSAQGIQAAHTRVQRHERQAALEVGSKEAPSASAR